MQPQEATQQIQQWNNQAPVAQKSSSGGFLNDIEHVFGGGSKTSSPQVGGRSSGTGFWGHVENLLPLVGSVGGMLLAPETGGLSAILATALLGGGGSALGKVTENAIQHGKSDLTGGVLGEAGLGAAGGLAGGALGAVAGKVLPKVGIDADSTIARLLGAPSSKTASTEGLETPLQTADEAAGTATPIAGQKPMNGFQQSIYKKGSGLRASVRNLQPTVMKDPGSSLNVASRVNELNDWADNYQLPDGSTPFQGSAAHQASTVPVVANDISNRLSSALASDTQRHSVDEVGQKIIDGVSQNKNYYGDNIPTMDQDTQNILQGVNKLASANPDGKLSSADLQKVDQMIDSSPKMKFGRLATTASNPADLNTDALMAARTSVRGMLADVNPAASKEIDNMHNLEQISSALNTSSKEQAGSGGIRLGATPRFAKPVGGKAIQSLQDASGRALQEVGEHPATAVGAGAFHQTVTRGLADSVNTAVQDKDMQKLQSQGINSTTLGNPSPEVAQLLQQVTSQQQQGVTGLPFTVAQVQQAEEQDMEQTGGKNMGELTKLATLAQDQQGNSLSDAASKQLDNYQNALGMVSTLAKSFENGSTNTQQLQQEIDNFTKSVEAQSGISTSAFAKLMPSVNDSPATAIAKLASLKQAMDSQVEDTLQNTISSSSTNSSSTLDNLMEQIANGQTQTSSVPSPNIALPGETS